LEAKQDVKDTYISEVYNFKKDHHHPLLEEPLQPPATPIPSFYIKEKPIIRFFERRELLLNYSFHTT